MKKIFIIKVGLLILCVFLTACSGETQSEGSVKNKNNEITTYDQLLQIFENKQMILVDYYINKVYTEKQIRDKFPSLASINNKINIKMFEHDFQLGKLDQNGNIIYSGEVKWNVGGIEYRHTYNYIFLPSNSVNISGSDSKIDGDKRGPTHDFILHGELGSTVKVYAYNP
jgi:hypothetical protein